MNLQILKKEKNREGILYGSLAAFMLLKFLYYGLTYFPVADDWIQYGTYPFHDNPFVSVILKARTYSNRPLAAFFDPYVWGKFWGNMWAALLIITLCHFAAMVLLHKVMKKNGLYSGSLGLLIFGGAPIVIEATYWISASSRLVFGMFLAVLSWHILMKCIESEHNRVIDLFLYATVSFMSLSFYEQIIPVSVIGSALILYRNRNVVKRKWLYAIPWVNLMIICIYYAVFMSHSKSASRSGITLSMIPERISAILGTVRTIFIRNQKLLMTMDSSRGFQLVLEDGAYFFLLLIILTALAVGIAFWIGEDVNKEGNEEMDRRIHKNRKISWWLQVVIGIVFAVLPYSPFLVLNQGGWDLRNAFPSVLGIAIAADAVVGFCHKFRWPRLLLSMFVSFIALVFLVVHVSVLAFYKEVSERDRLTGESILAMSEGFGVAEGHKNLAVFDPKYTYSNANYLYGSSIAGGTAANWSMTGLLRALSGNLRLPMVYHLPDGVNLGDSINDIEESFLVVIDHEGKVIQLEFEKLNEDTMVLTTESGERFGQILRMENGFVYGREPIDLSSRVDKSNKSDNGSEPHEEAQRSEQTEDVKEEGESFEPEKEEVLDKEVEGAEPVPTFVISVIDEDYKSLMEGKSYTENPHITYDDLRLLNVAYVDFEGETKQGELVVNKVIADDMLEIFRELYEAAYPIEKVSLVDYYDADDDLSMVDNNTSAFNYRVIAGTDKLSNHAYGLAIDINPLVNPYVTRSGIFPPEGEAYADRENVRQGMIYRNDVCYKAFTSRGFIWGGDWSKSKDYQHFDIWIDGINK